MESAEIKIKQVWRWIDASECPIEIKVIAGIFLYEATAWYNLEHVSAQTVPDTLADICFMFFVCQCAGAFANGMKLVCLLVGGIENFLNVLQGWLLTFACQFNNIQSVAIMIEYQQILIENIHDVGGIVFLHRLIFYRDVFKITHSIIGSVSVKSATTVAVACYGKV